MKIPLVDLAWQQLAPLGLDLEQIRTDMAAADVQPVAA